MLDDRQRTTPLRRRLLVGAAAAVAAGRLTWAAAAAAPAFTLLPAGDCATLRRRVPPAVAAAVLAQARVDVQRQPHFLALVHTEGLLDGEGNREASRQAQLDWEHACLQALAARLGGGAAHQACALRYLDAWLGHYTPSFNPIDETRLPYLLYAADLLHDSLAPAQAGAIGALGRALAGGYLADPVRVGSRNSATNNWHSHRVKLATAGAFASGDGGLVQQARAAFERQVASNIDAAGQVIDFAQRDALHYVVYSLEPLLQSVAMAAAHGQDWFHAPGAGQRLQLALDWLAPYAQGRGRHEEFVRSTVEFDRRRARAGVPGWSGAWQPGEAAPLFWLAARCDARYAPVLQALTAPAWVQALFSTHNNDNP